ncbi:MAG: VWA domain-containing protein [Muribaculaceae bacterium]|nr:VWA domain-containing protein [Muribaculaceae bacterium]
MFSFANPGLLYLLLLVPVMVGLFLLARMARKRKLERYGNLSILAPLMPDASVYKPWIRLTLQLIALSALVIAVARPRFGEKEETERSEGIEVMIAMDVSRSMLASSSDDPSGVSRLERAKYILSRLIDKLGNDKVGLVVFAGEAYTQLPITTDFVSAKMYLNDITTDMVPSQGTAIGTAIGMAVNAFTPDPETGKAIIVITDGENHEGNAVEMAQQAKSRGVQVDVIGIGSTKGAPIPINQSKGEFLKDYNGQVVTTALNENMAREIAAAGDGVYISGVSSSALNELTTQLDNLQKSELTHVTYKASAEQFPIFGWIALAFMVIDIFVLDRKISWLKSINFFTKEN